MEDVCFGRLNYIKIIFFKSLFDFMDYEEFSNVFKNHELSGLYLLEN
jgi:hypothetical protein